MLFGTVGPKEKEVLERVLRGVRDVSVWGVEPGRSGSAEWPWVNLRPGDAVVFAGLKRVMASGVVIAKLESVQPLGDRLWASPAWRNIYLISGLKLHDLPFGELNRAAGYRPTARPQNLRLVVGPKAANILRWLGSIRRS